MPYLDLSDGTPLWYERRGAGRPVVLLQGLQFPAGYFWRPVVERLAGVVETITLDLRGQGLSGKPAHGHTVAQNAADLAHAVQALGLKLPVVAGVAFGGMVALRMALDHAQPALGGLCLSEMTPRLPDAPGWEHPTFGAFPVEAARGFGAQVRADRDAALGPFLHACFAHPPAPETLAEMRGQCWLTPTDTVAAIIDSMAEEDTRERLSEVRAPTLLIYGRKNNPVMPGSVGRWMADRIPGSQLVELDSAGHSPFWDDPDAFASALAGFVRSLP